MSQTTKTLLFAAWSILVVLAAIAVGTTSVTGWFIAICLAIGPPVLARSLWHAPEQTLSERIHDARQ